MEIQKILTQLPQVANEWKTLQSGLIGSEDLPIIEAFKGDKLNLISPVTLRENLAYIFTLIGLTRLPDTTELEVIEDYIRTTYPFFTIQEMRIAFKMAVQGKLDCNIEHYEKFSPKYISGVMNAYKLKANQVRKNLPPPPDQPVKQLTEQEIVDFTEKEWLSGKREDFNRVFNADKVFKILLKQSKLNFTQDQIITTINVVREDNLYRLNRMHPQDAKEFAKRIKQEDFIDLQCKKLALVKYFENKTD